MENYKTQEPLAVANYVIECAQNHDMTIANLQLQKILFFVQGYALNNISDKGLIDGAFAKWQYGPVQKDVYHAFNSNGASPITNEYAIGYFDEKGNFKTNTPSINRSMLGNKENNLKNFILKLLKIPSWKLVELTHEDSSWFKFKNEIMNYSARDYTSEEIKNCYLNNKKELENIID